MISSSASSFNSGPEKGSHLKVMAVCSGVRPSAMARTSASALRNSGDPYAGGGGELISFPDSRKNGRAPSPPRTIAVPLLVHVFGVPGGLPGDVSPKLSPAAYASTAAPIVRPIASPAAKSMLRSSACGGSARCTASAASIDAPSRG